MKQNIPVSGILFIILTGLYVSGCAAGNNFQEDLCEYLCPEKSVFSDSKLISYTLSLREMNDMELQEEHSRIKEQYLNNPDEDIMLRYATILSLPGPSFMNLDTSRILLKSYLEDPDQAVLERRLYAEYLLKTIGDRVVLKSAHEKLANALVKERKKHRKLQDQCNELKEKLDALKSIEKSIKARQETLGR